MDLTPDQRLHGFRVERTEPLSELEAETALLRHEKSGARLLVISNDDEDKAFSIAFKTPPKDDTGVFHILEHSVLCGSRRFPVKEPFVNLLKSSMQTFLNAMTFPDKTMYPVASTNEQDLYNLMDVYLDAVLHPNIYRKRAIFEQEGWHYELDSVDGQLAYNGVVFNEMKGALSDPDSVLYDAVNGALFPDTAYRFESGGHPRAIPTLTYEDYLDEHARHYRLDNSYLFLYGNLDVERALTFLDERYLDCEPAPAPELGAPNPLVRQEPREAWGVRTGMVTAPENACAALGYVIGDATDRERVLATGILADALMGSNESPLKKALLDAQLAGDAYAFVDDARLQPLLMVELKGSKPDVLDEFRAVFEREAERLAREGIDRTLIEASLEHQEFLLREMDFGTSKGVVHAMNCLSGWLYDDEAAVDSLRWEGAFARMRAGLDEGYFEQLLRELVLENDHRGSVEIVPEEAPARNEEAEELAAKQAALTAEEAQAIVDECAALHRLQEAPDTPEDLATLPLLELSDIAPSKEEPPARLDESTPLPCLRHDIRTHGIDYFTFYFDLSHVSFDELPYVSILTSVLGKLDTAEHTAVEVDTLVQRTLGRLRFSAGSFAVDGTDDVAPKFMVDASCLGENVEDAVRLVAEIWGTSRLDDTARVQAILQQRRIGMEQYFANSGHSAASMRVAAGTSRFGVMNEALGGVEFYLFLKDVLEHFDERAEELTARLQDVAHRVFTTDVVVSFTGADEDLERAWAAGGDFALTDAAALPSDAREALTVPAPAPRNEAFTAPCDVCFAAAGDMRAPEDGAHDGVWSVVNRLMTYDYLWTEVRVKGGAYGAGFSSTRRGMLSFYSYRDPNLDATLERFDQAGTWLANFAPTEKEMRGYVISTVAGIDAPVTPRALARRQDSAYFCRLPHDWRARLRDEALHATPDQLRAQAPVFDRLKGRRAVCVFGGKQIIEGAKAQLDVRELY